MICPQVWKKQECEDSPADIIINIAFVKRSGADLRPVLGEGVRAYMSNGSPI